jgi:hypothetical protein
MERKFETMVRWRSETIVQWIDRFEAPLAELEVARDGLAAYTEDELTYLWKRWGCETCHFGWKQRLGLHVWSATR